MAKRRKKKPVSQKPQTNIRAIENPDWRPDRDGEKAFPRTVNAEVNVKESAVETLFARRFLSSSQKLSADRFRAVWEAAGGKTASLDYSMDRVDGGKADPMIGHIRAAQELQRCRNLLGARGFEVVQSVCGEGHALSELSQHKRERLTIADNLRADLDDLATMWGLQTRQRASLSRTCIVSEAKQNA